MLNFTTEAVFVGAAALLVLALLGRLGGMVPAGNMPVMLRPMLGWSVAALVLTVVGVLTPINLNWACVGLGLVALVGPLLMKRRDVFTFNFNALWVFLPFGVVMLGTGVALWDDFAHRLPNTRFIWDFGQFPGPELPAPSGNMPAYPYGGNWLGAWVNLVLGTYAETGQALLQVAMGLTLALWLGWRWLGDNAVRWPYTAAAVGLVGFAVNPVFQPALVGSAYNDATLGWVVLLALVVGLKTLEKSELRWGFGLLLALGVMLKDTGVVVCGLVGMSVLVVGVLRGLKVTELVQKLWPAVVLSVGVFGLWKGYGMVNLPVPFVMRPLAEWNWAQVPQMVDTLGVKIWEEPQHFLPTILLLGVVGWRWVKEWDVPVFARVALVIWAAWAGILGVMYLAAFSPLEGANLASLDRYLQHVNWAVWVALVDFCGPLMGRWGSPIVRKGVVVCALVLPLLLADKLVVRSDPSVVGLRGFGREMGQLMPAGSKVVVLDMAGSGYAAQVLTYEWGHRVQVVRQMNSYTPQEQLELGTWFGKTGATHLLVLSVNDQTRTVLGDALPKQLPQLYACEKGTLRCRGLLGAGG